MKNSRITIPKRLTAELAEFVGIIMGDGYLYGRNKRYIIGIVGHPKNDNEYFLYIVKLIKNLFNKDVQPKIVGRGLRIIFSSKLIYQYITNNYVPYFPGGKSDKVIIPTSILDSWIFARHTIRGLADTDGSVFTSEKPGILQYPSIEITTSSKNLAIQLKELLEHNGFRVTKIWNYLSKNSRRITYKLGLNGLDNLELWIKEIGFSNPIKRKKAVNILKKSGLAGI